MFESGALNISENDLIVKVCVLLSHTNLQRPITIDFTPQSGSANSKSCIISVRHSFGNNLLVFTGLYDFISLTTQIDFEIGITERVCLFLVQIVDDDIFEDLETFEIVMSTLDSAVEIPQPVVIVTIHDDDRMFT